MNEDKRRITIDFKYLVDVGYKESDKGGLLEEAKKNNTAYYDKRNDIWCITDLKRTSPLELYKNYIEYINSNYNNWNNTSICLSYLDMGLVPVVWTPSFMQSYLANDFHILAEKWKIDLLFLPASSLLKRGYVGATKDVWVKKKDLAKVLNVSESQANLSTILKLAI